MKHTLLPTGWVSAKLGDCCDIVAGGTPKRDHPEFWNGTIPWATPKDISNIDDPVFMEPPECITTLGLRRSAATLLPKGAILLSSRAPIGLVAIAGQPMATNQGFKSLVPGPCLDSRFLYHAIKRMVPKIAARGNGATFKEVSKSVLSQIELAFPREIDQQQRIASILDNADSIRRKRKQVATLTDDLMRSAFIEVFGDPSTNSKKWPVTTIRKLAREVKYGTSKKANAVSGKYPILRMGNLTFSGRLDLRDLKYIDFDSDEVRKYTVQKDDILFNRTNSKELVGKTAVFDQDEPYAFAGYLIRVRVNEKADPYYISGYLNTAHGKATLRAMCKSIIGMANINAQELQDIPIASPPIEIQRKYRAFVDRVIQSWPAATAAQSEGERLFESLSQQAFKGVL
jgi:type I restriction enzyme, S subunit